MFTGLVQGIGTIHFSGKRLLIEVPPSFSRLALGDSISVDGVCLTVAEIRNNGFFADVSEETLNRTVLNEKAARKKFVNLEPALTLSDRLGGHLVSGHIDGLGKVLSIENLSNSWNLQIGWENNLYAKYTCEKGSIALNGVSLTISEIKREGQIFSLAIIPHTWSNTSLQYLKTGEQINLEADLMAKYAESLLIQDGGDKSSKNKFVLKNTTFSKEWLIDNGFD